MDLPSFSGRERAEQAEQGQQLLLLTVNGRGCGEVHVEELLSADSLLFFQFFPL